MNNRYLALRKTAMAMVLWLLMFGVNSASAQTSVSYFVLAQTVEPLMIVRDGDPMAGGLFTDILKKVFENSEYVIEPTVMPWQRMKEEFKRSDNWVTYGGKDWGIKYDDFLTKRGSSRYKFSSKLNPAPDLGESDFQITPAPDNFG